MEFATIIVDNVLGRLASFASQEICLAWGGQLELIKLNNALFTIKLVLKDAEKKQVTNPLITCWLGQLKDVCHDVDDVLDELEFQKLRKEVQANNLGKLRREVRQFFSHWNPVVFNFKMGHKVKEIRERLVKIEKDKREFSFVELAQDHCAPQKVRDARKITTSKVKAEGHLSHEECMSLFITRAFNKGEEQDYQHLIEIGEDIVKKCEGVPLAVAAVGSMLYLKRERHQWLSVKDDVMWSITTDDILPALKLSYIALPAYLKHCFAFCSLFPKGFEFNSQMLAALWTSQGYVTSNKKDEDLEQMGMDYVREMCSRCLFQVETDMKTFIEFKIHDKVHDLAIWAAQVEYSTVNSRPSSDLAEMVRHVSISRNDLVGKEPNVPDFMLKSKKLRTILIPEVGRGLNQRFLKTCICKFKCMRVLDLRGAPLVELPTSIGSLFHLRFLNLSGNEKIKRLPDSICKLLNLESLSLWKCTALKEIPKDIWNLINLRSLVITTQQTDLPKGIKRLTLLQYLSFEGCINLKSLGEEIQFLNNLRKLAISSCNNLESGPPNMKQMTALDTLAIRECDKLQLMGSTEGPQGLRSLFIEKSSMVVLPSWIEDSANTLQSIALFECHNLTAVPELTSFTSLERLHVRDCSKLLDLPEGLHCLSKLSQLKIERCSTLSRSCKRQFKGVDWSKTASQAKI